MAGETSAVKDTNNEEKEKASSGGTKAPKVKAETQEEDPGANKEDDGASVESNDIKGEIPKESGNKEVESNKNERNEENDLKANAVKESDIKGSDSKESKKTTGDAMEMDTKESDGTSDNPNADITNEGKKIEDEPQSTEGASDITEHARIDDPIEPPARNAPKRQHHIQDSPEASSPSTFLPIDSNSVLSRLFDPDRKQKPALWSHIKLVAPGPADRPPPGHLRWRSKDAIAAYCLKCKKQFTYTKGTSKTISRHMMAYHGMVSTSGEMADEETPVKKRGHESTPRSAEPPLKKRKPDLGKVRSPTQLLLKWLVGSFRPFTIVEDPGLNDYIKSCSSERMPSAADMLRLALEHATKVKEQLKSQLESCDYYSLGCEQFDHNGTTFWAIKVSFCTISFERMSFTLAVNSGSSCGAVVKETLEEFGLSASKIMSVTLRNVAATQDLELEGFSNEGYIYDVLHQMDTLLMQALDDGDVGSLLGKIRKQVSDSYGYVQKGDAFAKISPEFGNTIVDIHRLLQKFQSPQGIVDSEATKDSDKWTPSDSEQYMAKALGVILKPFFDATTTLSGEKFPTVGLAVPVFRRIHDVLGKVDLKELSTENVDKGTVASMQEFLKSLATSFSATFSSILNDVHPLMWTIPLDPRLVHMLGLSEDEKEAVTKSLVEEVKKVKQELGGIEENDVSNDESKKQESSTMGGIFWGEDAGEKGSSSALTTFAKATVDRYFNTVRSHRRIEDPLDWWKSNQAQFAELSFVARQWFGGSATLEGISSEKKNFSGENFGLLAFLHENIDRI